MEESAQEKSYQVIARRWRPKNFTELVGQDHIVRTLSNAIEQDRIAHAYLFVGPRGTGKTSTARLFAMALNAEGGSAVDFDINSEISQSILKGSCMDVIEIDGASNNSVDQIRDLREECIYAPTQCRYKIYIIDEVHMLSTAAFNALLKTLEEPPEHVKFFFATTEAHKVLPTIVSRCQRFEFRPIAAEVIADKLGVIAEAEGVEIGRESLMAVARLACGGMRDSQSILDQLISFCGKSIEEQDILDVYGLASNADLEAIGEAIAAGDHAKVLEVATKLAENGSDLHRVLVDLKDRVHAAMMDAISNSGESSQLGYALKTHNLMQIVEALQEGAEALKTGLSEKVTFELALLKAIDRGRAMSIDHVIKEITQMGNQVPEDVVVPKFKITEGEDGKKEVIVEVEGKVMDIEEAKALLGQELIEMLEEKFRASYKRVVDI